MHRVVCVVMKRKSCQLGRKDQHPHIYTYVYSHIVVTYMYIKICMWGGATVHPTGGEEAYVGSAGTVVCGASSKGYAPLPIRSISFYIYTCVYIYIYIYMGVCVHALHQMLMTSAHVLQGSQTFSKTLSLS